MIIKFLTTQSDLLNNHVCSSFISEAFSFQAGIERGSDGGYFSFR